MITDRKKDHFSLAIIQSDLFWEDRNANLNYFEEQIRRLGNKIDLIVLPETFSTGFTMNVEQYADAGRDTLDWMINLASTCNTYLAGSIIVKEDGKYYNRLYWVHPEGRVEYYDKRHLFRMGGEQNKFTHGERRVVVTIGRVRILLQICYDLRFPVFSRNKGDYDVILYVANWPSKRKIVWETLIPARAIENQAYVIAANRSGCDGEGGDTCGTSCVIDPKGITKARLSEQPGLLVTSINLNEIHSFRNKFPAHEDADAFSLE